MNEKQKDRFKRLAARCGMLETPNWLDKALDQWDGEFWQGLHRGSYEMRKQAGVHWKRWRGHKRDLEKQLAAGIRDRCPTCGHSYKLEQAQVLLMAEHSSAITYESASKRLAGIVERGEAVPTTQFNNAQISGVVVGTCKLTYAETPSVHVGPLQQMTWDEARERLSPQAWNELATLAGRKVEEAA